MIEVDLIAVKGKSDPVGIYELLAEHGKLKPEVEDRRARSEQALGAVSYTHLTLPTKRIV